MLRTDLEMTELLDVRLLTDATHATIYNAIFEGKEVVVKMLSKKSEANERACREFRMEMQIMKLTKHKNIVECYGFGETPRPFIVMQYLTGGTLRDKYTCGALRRVSSIPILKAEQTVGRVAQKRHSFDADSATLQRFQDMLVNATELAGALQYLHSDCIPSGMIIYRDLKPDNIGVLDDRVKLFDFNLSVIVDKKQDLDEPYELSGCTGTLRYMAPEVALQQPYSEKADVYGFGIILWQMASGLVPFQGLDRMSFMEEVVEGGLRPAVLPHWPLAFSDLLETCWDANPQIRPSFDNIMCTLKKIQSI
jgi:serine/threonine protein kinase